MNKLNLVAFLLCALYSITACVQEIPAPSPGERKVSVSCVLNNSDTQRLTLTYSKAPYSGSYFNEVEHAEATLYENNQPVGVFTKDGYGEWELAFRPEPGAQYRLEVKIPGEPVLSAVTSMPDVVDISLRDLSDEGCTKVLEQYSSSNPFWLFVMMSSLYDIEYLIHPPVLADDPGLRLFAWIGTDHKDADRFNQDGSMSEEISGYSKTLMYKNYVRVAAAADIDSQHPYTFMVQNAYSDASFVVIRTASEEYDRYIKSVIEKKTFYESDDDPVRWFDESSIYSNIENGLGIFAAYNEQEFYSNIYMLEL